MISRNLLFQGYGNCPTFSDKKFSTIFVDSLMYVFHYSVEADDDHHSGLLRYFLGFSVTFLTEDSVTFIFTVQVLPQDC